MIRIQSTGGTERKITPIFVCDICQKPIEEIGAGAAVFRGHGLGEDDLHDVLHVHKKKCLDIADLKLVGEGRQAPWHELRDHVNDVVAGMNIDLRQMIMTEANWTGALDITSYNELQEKISELFQWLHDHGVHSALWSEDFGDDDPIDETDG